MTFFAVVSSPLLSSHVIFLNSATKKNNFWWLLACYPLKGVTRSVPPHLPPLVTSLVKLSEFITNTKFDYELQNIIANHYVLAL